MQSMFSAAIARTARRAPRSGLDRLALRSALRRVASFPQAARIGALRASIAAVAGAAAIFPWSGAAAGAAAEPFVRVDDPWVRATVEGQTGSGAYLRLTSSRDAVLVGARSDVAARVEIHEMRLLGDVMQMRRIERLPLPAHTPVALEHDYHIMFIGLRHQLLAGQKVHIELQVLDDAQLPHTVAVDAPVRALNSVGRAN